MPQWRGIPVGMAMLLAMMVPTGTQAAEPMPEEWQAVIAGQIAAFHAGDGDSALGFASAQFRAGFADPEAFLAAITAWGYAPIMQSRSESYGKYTLIAPDEVVQSVTIVGPDMVVYLALYDLQREADGWRIKAVQMNRTGGMGA